MADKALQLLMALEAVNEKNKALQPYLDQINELDENITQLEQVVKQLDVYTKKLGDQFKRVYRVS